MLRSVEGHLGSWQLEVSLAMVKNKNDSFVINNDPVFMFFKYSSFT